jgi:hypothetical protein
LLEYIIVDAFVNDRDVVLDLFACI